MTNIPRHLDSWCYRGAQISGAGLTPWIPPSPDPIPPSCVKNPAGALLVRLARRSPRGQCSVTSMLFQLLM